MLLGFGNRIALVSKTEELKREALEFAEMALSIDNMDSTVLGLTGCCIADIGYPERGESLLRNAIDMNSSNAQAWVALGAVRLFAFPQESGGRHDYAARSAYTLAAR